MYALNIVRPTTLAAAKEALKTENTKLLSGGQTFIPTLKSRLARPDLLVSLSKIAELTGVDAGAGVLLIKAGTVHRAVAEGVKTIYPALSHLASHIGDPAVRNRGTIGGSLANNDPSACYPSAALGSGATIVTDRREISADDYFLGMFETALDENEIITAVKFPIPSAAAYIKFIQPASRFALVGVFLAKFADGVRVAVTGASENGVFRWTEAEAALSKNFDPAVIESLAIKADSMIGDLHGTKEYRAHLINVLTRRAVLSALGKPQADL